MTTVYDESSTGLLQELKAMRLSGMAEALEAQLQDTNSNLKSFSERIYEIVSAEWNLRYSKKYNRFFKKASLKYPAADIDSSIYDADRLLDTQAIEQLATCHWIEESRNLLTTGSTGSGKTYIGNALCVSALRLFKTVRYTKANHLIYELEQARIANDYLACAKKLTALDLLVIDDFGLMELDLDKCRNLFEVIDGRDSSKSTMIISQMPVSSWYEIFKDSTYADACMDRIIHNAYRLEFNGRNMRNPT